MASLARQYGRGLHKYLSSHLRNTDDVPDLAQEVYLRLLRVNQEAVIRNPEAYLFTVARHVLYQHSLDQPATASFIDITEVDISEQMLKLVAPAGEKPSARAENAQRVERFQKVLARLPPRIGAALVMHRIGGYTVQEVADELGVARETLALMATLIGAGFLFLALRSQTYSTGIGEQRTLLLTDGSTVILNALTTVRVHMTKKAREITLIHGQAYFRDVDEPDRPFIVHSSAGTVRAIGTEFDVDQESDRTVVTVLQGRVAVARSFARIDRMGRSELLRDLAGSHDKLKAVLVPAGEQVTLLAHNVPAPKPVDVGTVTAWLQQRLIFDDTPLEKVAQQFNLYSRRRLVIADPSLRSVGVSGVYSASDPAALIGFLRSQPTLRVVETGDEIRVTSR